MKYQVIIISEYLVTIKEYRIMDKAVACFKKWTEDAKKFPQLGIKHIYLTVERGIMAEWDSLNAN